MTSPRRRALLTTASIAVALAAADTYVVVLALTDMMAGVGLGIDALQQATPIISGFLLGYVAVLPLIGRISDLVARQRVLLWCLTVFVAGSAITALAHDLPTLVTGRVVQGVGGGGLVPATLAIVGELWPPERRGVPLGVVGAVQELGSVLGPVLGALVLTIADWRMIFWLNAALGTALAVSVLLASRRLSSDLAGGPAPGRQSIDSARPGAEGATRSRWRRRTLPRLGAGLLWVAAAAVTALALAAPEDLRTSVEYGAPFVPVGESNARVLTPIGLTGLALLAVAAVTATYRARPLLRRADLPGALLLGGAVGCVILTFAAAEPEKEVVGPLGYTLLPVAVLLVVGYVLHQRRATNPVVPRETITGRTTIALLVSFLVGVALVAVVVDIPVLARLVHTDSQVSAALVLLRFLVAVPVGALAGGILVRRLGDGLVTAIGLSVGAIALGVMATWGAGSLAGVGSYVVLVALGLGIGLTLAPINNTVLARTARDLHGTASALVVVSRMVGMVVGLALLTGIGLNAYYREVAALPDPTDTDALVGAGLVQVHAVFVGAAVAAALGAVLALAMGIRRGAGSGDEKVTSSPTVISSPL